MSDKILITGINGFVGKHLAREFSDRGCEVVGIGRESQLDPTIKALVSNYYVCDLTDPVGMAALPLGDIDAAVSLAGLANVGASFDNPDLYNKINVEVFSVLANCLLAVGSSARVIAVSTGAVYDANQTLPLTEDSALISTGSPYALSKIAMEKAVMGLRAQGLNCAVVRPFNHIGPGQEPGFLLPDLYRGLKDASQSGGVLKVGDLSTKRDYTDVRDVVKAYVSLALASELNYPTYNVCSGHSIEGAKILELLLKACGQDGKITVATDPALVRPTDPKDLYGSNERLRTQVGWQPTIPLEQTISDFVSQSIQSLL